VVRNFLGSLHNKLSFTRRVYGLGFEPGLDSDADSKTSFEMEQVTVDSLGFTDCCRWVLRDIGATGSQGQHTDATPLSRGDVLPVTGSTLEEAATRPPRFLQEHELISLMDQNGIGTDASMAVHVSNIVERGYVSLCDETGQPLRGPRRPGSKPLPRQIGRYMVPTALGISFMDIFDRDERIRMSSPSHYNIEPTDSRDLLSQPTIRRQMEDEVKGIASGLMEKDHCLEKNLDWFEERYRELERSLDRKRIKEFGKSLSARKTDLNVWRAQGVFEPKQANPSPPRRKQHAHKQSNKVPKQQRPNKQSNKKQSNKKQRPKKSTNKTKTRGKKTENGSGDLAKEPRKKAGKKGQRGKKTNKSKSMKRKETVVT